MEGDYAPVLILAAVMIALGTYVWSQNDRYFSDFNITSVMATSGLDPTPLLTARFPLEDAPAALEAARDTSRNVKVQIEC